MSRMRFTIRRASRRTGTGTGTATGAGTGGRFVGTVFFLIWCAIPAVMLVMMVRQVFSDAGPWLWKPADCTIVDNGVAEAGSDGDYAFTVRYTYAAGPLSAVEAPIRHGDVYARGYRGSSDYSDAQRLALRYAPGSRATCYVNPSDPTQAVLKREPPWLLLLVPLPLLFLALGVAALWFIWRDNKPARAAAAAPISSGGSAGTFTGCGAWVVVVLCGAFFIVGAAVLWAMGGRVVNVFAARSWTPVPATVLSSGVRSHRGDDSTTYSVNILYLYHVRGREYRSNRYGFMGGSGSGYQAKRKIVSRYRPGTRFTAYVDPADPVEAVIERGFTWDMLLLLIPLVFIGGGGAGLYLSSRHARRLSLGKDAAQDAPRHSAAPLAGRYLASRRSGAPQAGPINRGRFATGPVSLKPRQSPSLRFVGITGIALFWNGIVSIFLFQAVKEWMSGRVEVCLSIFLIPFVAIGVGLIVGVLYSLLALFNPRCNLTLDRQSIVLGDAVEVKWTFAGRYDRVHRLVLRVEGREEATYRQGTNTHMDKNVFYVHELADASRAVDVYSGKARWAVPAQSMHSFSAPNNKIMWVLCLHGHIQGWPDVKDEYVLAVAPLPAKKMLSAVESDPQAA